MCFVLCFIMRLFCLGTFSPDTLLPSLLKFRPTLCSRYILAGDVSLAPRPALDPRQSIAWSSRGPAAP